MSWLSIIAAFAGALISAFVIRDLYACTGQLQRTILHLGAKFVPEHQREETYNQWLADLLAMPPSELLRLAYAIDCIRGGAALGLRVRLATQREPAATGKSANTNSSASIDALLIKAFHAGSKVRVSVSTNPLYFIIAMIAGLVASRLV